jgi:extracellular factor (EF) 3-hydroxypalmitic acid methyl ester biosynthesis protein
VLDLSATGFAVGMSSQPALAPGSVLESFELVLGDRPIWAGEAAVVHGTADRIGGRFTSGVIDLHHLRLGATLESRMEILREQRQRLPAEWRAAVADLRQLLEDVRFDIEQFERAEPHNPMSRAEQEKILFRDLGARWGSEYYGAVAQLHEMSKDLDVRAAELGRSYASSMLMPLLIACHFDRRVYEKPLGYAGDHRMMELLFADEPVGEDLFARFLHSIAKSFTLGRTVVAREVVMRDAVRAAVDAPGVRPVRILALAAGPAIELRRFISETNGLPRPVELILVDQDRTAHETAHGHLTRLLLERHHGTLPISVRCVHFSVRQILKPRTSDDERIVNETLADLDLVYSAGLYDYLPEPVAAALTRVLYGRLRGGGRMLLGNLIVTPDTTWMMDYVWGWPLLYRTEELMIALAGGLAPAPTRERVIRDSTGRCLFLDVTKPETERPKP